ncbi:hypothetical protein ACEPPN_010019 [Leptodophora sp. 'Broadleaf-Isolate-01']
MTDSSDGMYDVNAWVDILLDRIKKFGKKSEAVCLATAYNQLGICHIHKKQVEEAMDNFEKSVVTYQNLESSAGQLLVVHFPSLSLANLFVQQGQPEEGKKGISNKRAYTTMGALKIDVIGGKENFWLHSELTGFDLTHPPTPTSTPVYPRISLNTTTERVAIDPSKTALVVVDLQNYFLSTSLGRPSDAAGLKVVDRLLKHAIPACRKAGIPVVWLNWGLTQQDIEGMPPTIVRGFAADNNFSGRRKIGGLGAEVGPVELDDGSVVDGGKVLMLGQWNSASYTPLEKVREHQDICINKNRLSGFWGGTAIEEALKSRGIRTLLFAGCNTDQCVGGSLQDAFTRDWDCLLLSDGCATTSPKYATDCIEFNTEGGWGFVLTCKDLAEGVDNLQTSPTTMD